MNDANSIVGDLMFGRDFGGVDIPYGSVRGLSDRSRTPNDLTYVSVGSVAIREGGVQ